MQQASRWALSLSLSLSRRVALETRKEQNAAECVPERLIGHTTYQWVMWPCIVEHAYCTYSDTYVGCSTPRGCVVSTHSLQVGVKMKELIFSVTRPTTLGFSERKVAVTKRHMSHYLCICVFRTPVNNADIGTLVMDNKTTITTLAVQNNTVFTK